MRHFLFVQKSLICGVAEARGDAAYILAMKCDQRLERRLSGYFHKGLMFVFLYSHGWVGSIIL